MEYKACAITGHRPTRFKWKYNENNNGCKRLKRRLKAQLVLPFIGHDRDWDPKSRRRLSVLRQKSTEAVVAGNAEDPPVTNYRLRNQYMVDHADYLLAVYDNDRNLRSGTMQTVNYARRKQLPITLIHPDSAAVSYENQSE